MTYTLRLPRTPVLMLGSALAAAAAVLVVIGVIGLFSSGSGTGPAVATFTADGQAFRIAVPDGWRALPAAQLRRAPGSPAALLRRADGRGVIVVEPSSPVQGNAKQLASSLTTQLRHRFRGFHPIGARLVNIRAGRAFAYTFVRDPAGTVQTIALAAVNGRTWMIDAVVPANAPQSAREAGAIIRTFGP